jgi:diketogulonate reductase-like aldo/keto reductase
LISKASELFPIAIGTYGIGVDSLGMGHEISVKINSNNDEHMKALMYSFEAGQNFISASFIYANGQTMRFLADFLMQVPRDKIFLTVMIENYIERINDIETQLDKYLGIMRLDYADAFLVHAPSVSKLPLDEIYYHMSKMIDKGKTRFLSGGNFSLDQLKLLVEKSGFKLFSIESSYNLECKANEDVGIIKYCNENDIAFICNQPLRRNRTANRNYEALVQMAEKYNKTQNQILLNWLAKEKKLLPIIKASKVEHVKENIEALNFELEKQDIEQLNVFRSKEFDSLKVDWNDTGEGIPIHKYPNQFQ